MEIDSKLEHKWQNAQSVEIAVKSANPSDKMPDSSNPGFMWLGGFKSDMSGTKAQAMVDHADNINCPSLRFDYSGHGLSGGKFIKGTISRWVDESLTVLRHKTEVPQVLVGSSMGGWIALRMAQELSKAGEASRLAGLLLIAPAPDFTAELMEPRFTEEQRALMQSQGFIEEPSEYSDEPNIITQNLIEDGRKNLVLNADLSFGVPIHILQGMKDPDVPYSHALRLMEALPHDDAAITMVKDGDHRLSRIEDIALLKRTMKNFLSPAA